MVSFCTHQEIFHYSHTVSYRLSDFDIKIGSARGLSCFLHNMVSLAITIKTLNYHDIMIVKVQGYLLQQQYLESFRFLFIINTTSSSIVRAYDINRPS